MRSKFLVVSFVLVVLMGLVTSASAQAVNVVPQRDATLCHSTIPADAQLDKYPIASGPLSLPQIADLGLKPQRLRSPFVGYNLHREIGAKCGGTWTLEVIPAGTMVLVGPDGYVAYLVACGNRLVWAGKPDPPAKPSTPPETVQPKRSPWEWFWGDPGPWFWRSFIDIQPNGGHVEMTTGDIHITADGQSVVRLYR